MAEFTHNDARAAEKYEHDMIYDIYSGVGDSTTVEEANEKLFYNIVEWLKSLDKEHRLATLCFVIAVVNEFSDELNEM